MNSVKSFSIPCLSSKKELRSIKERFSDQIDPELLPESIILSLNSDDIIKDSRFRDQLSQSSLDFRPEFDFSIVKPTFVQRCKSPCLKTPNDVVRRITTCHDPKAGMIAPLKIKRTSKTNGTYDYRILRNGYVDLLQERFLNGSTGDPIITDLSCENKPKEAGTNSSSTSVVLEWMDDGMTQNSLSNDNTGTVMIIDKPDDVVPCANVANKVTPALNGFHPKSVTSNRRYYKGLPLRINDETAGTNFKTSNLSKTTRSSVLAKRKSPTGKDSKLPKRAVSQNLVDSKRKDVQVHCKNHLASPSSNGKPPPSIGKPPPSIGKPPPSIGKPPPSIGKPSPSIGKPPPSIGKPPPSIGKPPPSNGKPSPTSNIKVLANEKTVSLKVCDNGRTIFSKTSNSQFTSIQTRKAKGSSNTQTPIKLVASSKIKSVTKPVERKTENTSAIRTSCSEKGTTDSSYVVLLIKWQNSLNKGSTNNPTVYVENLYDKTIPPLSFNYISQSIYSKGVPTPDSTALFGCGCSTCGDATKCCSYMAGQKFAYYKNGKLRVGCRTPIYECNQMCRCGPDCLNRVVQHGTQYSLCIFRTPDSRGWGVKTLNPIEKGKFVTEYVGELITSEEAERRGRQYDKDGTTYLFDLDFNDAADFTIDATQSGNVSHFLNHSCDPNLVVFPVWIDTLDSRLPRLALFARRNIQEGEELTFDYQMNHNMSLSYSQDRTPCLCGTKKCRGFLF